MQEDEISKEFDVEEPEISGWKTLGGDIFHPPVRSLILAVLVGNGLQVMTTFFVTIGRIPCNLLFWQEEEKANTQHF